MSTVKEIMVRKVVTVKENDTLQTLCNILVSKKLSGVPVVDKKDNLVGFISERDIIQAVAKDFHGKKVKDVMTSKVLSVEEDATIEQISQIFTDKPFRYIPVRKGIKLVGIVSRKDVIHKLLGQYY